MCLKSKAAVLTILWSLLASISYYVVPDLFLSYTGWVNSRNELKHPYILVGENVVLGIVSLLFVLGGLLGDIKCGQYRIIKYSLVLFVATPLVLCMFGSHSLILLHDPGSLFENNGTTPTDLAKVFTTFECMAVIMANIAYIAFIANVLPFAMDQLQDSPSQETNTFIHWYMWCLYGSILFGELYFYNINATKEVAGYLQDNSRVITTIGSYVMIVLAVLALIFLIASLCSLKHKQKWFYRQTGSIEPYKLVYKVSKFALQHKVPIRRSAFTYCEDELPSRLDLGKIKYGGPFSTEEVEDVKVFYGILKVIFSFMPISMHGVYSFIPFGVHLSYRQQSGDDPISSSNSSYYPVAGLYERNLTITLFVFLSIPTYLLIRKSSVFRLLPTLSIVRRMEIGIIIKLIDLVFMLVVDIAAHAKNENLGCMFDSVVFPPVFTQLQASSILVVESVFSGLAIMTTYIAYFEFICAQSPRSMKGMLIGLSYAAMGLFIIIGAALTIPFFYWTVPYASCGLGYYGINIVICLVIFVNFVRVAKNYRYRVRDEPCRVREYAENYYSNLQQEKFYDYSESM